MASCRQCRTQSHKIVYRLGFAAAGHGPALPRQKIRRKFMSALPLSGIKILDLTRVLAGPLSAQMLADLGAEVIKIERPGGGDDARAFGPPYLRDPEGKANNNNSFYLCANRNKKSVTVNIASPEGQDIIRELAKTADVMMENYKVGDLKRYGLDYETIKAINPGIIYCSVTGFGQTGLAETGHRAIDDARVDRLDRLVIEPVALEIADLVVLHHHIGGFCQLADDVLPLGRGDVDGNRLLVAVGAEIE